MSYNPDEKLPLAANAVHHGQATPQQVVIVNAKPDNTPGWRRVLVLLILSAVPLILAPTALCTVAPLYLFVCYGARAPLQAA